MFRLKVKKRALRSAVISVLFGEEIILLQGKANVSVNLHKQALFALHTSEMPQGTQETRGRKNRPLVPNTDLSGIFLKPLRAWNDPNNLPFVPKRRCLLVHSSSIPLL